MTGITRIAGIEIPSVDPVFLTIVAALVVTATSLAIARWAEDYHLLILGALAFLAAFLGRRARREQWRGWALYHIPGMGLSYVIMLTAFYVGNGKSLPLWDQLPPIAYWVLPAAIGVPLIVRTLRRHPLAQGRSGLR
jgi:peptidoglycan/LPS O-acetylase OafA/YrhL